MAHTRHIQARMSQRAINKEMIDLAIRFGVIDQDKVVLNKKGAIALLEELKHLQRVAERVLEQEGLVVVKVGDSIITTYRLNSYSRKKRR